jgi:periplasmic divalent cation tolerance protein
MSALIWCPAPDAVIAERLADALLEQQLIACANIIGPMRSRFRWEGELQTAEEYALMCKTRADLLEAACAFLASAHPYDTPAVAGWLCDTAPEATKLWLSELTPDSAQLL